MSALARNIPAEREEAPAEALTNAMADLWEQQTRLLLDNGGEALVRTRLARLLPRASGSDPQPRGLPANADDLRLLCLSHRSACREHARRMRSTASAGQFTVMAETFSTLAAWLEGEKSDV